MAERTPCEFFLIRYVPDAVKGEFVNIGVLLREAGAAGRRRGRRSGLRGTGDGCVACMRTRIRRCWRA